MMDEGLITPTASRFDLMTGLPNSPPLQGGNGFAQQQQQNTSLFEDTSPFRGGGGGFNPNASPTFANNNQQLLQLQAQQQQQFDLQRQIAQLGGAVNSAAGVGGFAAQMGSNNQANANDLIAEQMAIQQQLANLKLQQESLMARFGDMQANLAQVTNQQQETTTTSPRIGSQAQGQHRRIPSAPQTQPTGMMGQFGQGTGGVGAGTKAHARRVSVNTTSASSSPNPSQSPPMGSNPRGGFSGSSGGFTFGGASSGGAGGSNQQQQQSQGGFTFPPNREQQQQQRTQDGEFGGWGESSPGQGQGRQMGHHRKQSGSVSSLGGWTWTPSKLLPSLPTTGYDKLTIISRQINQIPPISPKLNRIFSNSQLTELQLVTLESLLSECHRSVPVAKADLVN
jgi:protein SSD1